jgi:DNA-binding PadR family transcriptional regulator
VAQSTRPDKRVYDVTASGRGELARWISEPLCGRGSTTDSRTRELAVKIRGAQFGEADAVRAQVMSLRRERSETLDTYRALEERQFPEPSSLTDSARNQYLVLRGGIRAEQGCVDWLDEVLSALGGSGE